ncbi:hypothetical protein [Curtobacterium sp. MCSS17_015]|uniref:hypothetical protein n=1 Tax=Curtobacterium sp. MCSS17_015 TaxID=2175666 RepID=UPI0011B85148|nr:hypothetical protein [Curtobacterium sp. MCSS17_015]WIB27874.1 hypothetical protein DEJ18_07240 [Curtobacterium sp. MCSS17_015]
MTHHGPVTPPDGRTTSSARPPAPVSAALVADLTAEHQDEILAAQRAEDAAEGKRARALARYEKTLAKATTRPQMQRALDRLLTDLERAGGNRPIG